MTNVLKIEAFSGASGDMFLGALAGLIDAYDDLLNLPKLLKFEKDAEIKISEVKKNGIACKQVKVIELVPQHHHRHLTDIIKIIEASDLTDSAKKIALEIFNIIGIAEAEVHGVPLEKIHFHEVGAVDSIIDICGSAYLLDKLKIEETYLTTLISGKGFVKTAHGLLPVPCPATKLIIEGVPYVLGDEDGERLTPTGAAIIKYLNPKVEQIPLVDLKTVYGVGEKEFKVPNLLRLSICEISAKENELYVIETNIDDSNGEFLGIEFQNKLLETGAIDFYLSQVIMKKGRPGLLLSIICNKNNFEPLTDFVLKFTSTIGLRYYKVNRIELERKNEKIDTDFGRFGIKVAKLSNNSLKVKPESSDVLKYAFEKNINPNELSNKIRGDYEKDK